jgi:hypothetical protein
MRLEHTWKKDMKCPHNTLPTDRPLWTPAVSCTTELYIRALARITLSSSVGDGNPMRCGFPKSHPFAIDKGPALFFFKCEWHSSHSSNKGVQPSCNEQACMLISCGQIEILSLWYLHMSYTRRCYTTTTLLLYVFNDSICYIYIVIPQAQKPNLHEGDSASMNHCIHILCSLQQSHFQRYSWMLENS